MNDHMFDGLRELLDKPLDPTVVPSLPTNEDIRRFYQRYEPAVDCRGPEDMPEEIEVGGGKPARGSSKRVRRGRLG